jgi:hypothetical protein
VFEKMLILVIFTIFIHVIRLGGLAMAQYVSSRSVAEEVEF